MSLPKFVLVEQSFPDRGIANIGEHIRKELSQADFAREFPREQRLRSASEAGAFQISQRLRRR